MHHRTKCSGIAVLALILAGVAAEAKPPGGGGAGTPDADLVLFNGKVYTVDQHHTVAQSVAIRDDQIVYVGDHDRLQEYLGQDTKYLTLKGKLVLPGFVDSHAHPLWAAHGMVNYVIADPFTVSCTLGEIETYVDANPDRTFFEIGGYQKSTFITETGSAPTKEDLDAIESDRTTEIDPGSKAAIKRHADHLANLMVPE